MKKETKQTIKIWFTYSYTWNFQRVCKIERDTIKISLQALAIYFLILLCDSFGGPVISIQNQILAVFMCCLRACVRVYTPIEATNRFLVYILMLPNSRDFILSAHNLITHCHRIQNREQ